VATQIARLPQQASFSQLSRVGLTVSRFILGLIFTLAGASIVVLLNNPPPAPPGIAGTFMTVFFQSHWVVFVDLVEFAAGALLLANRCVPFALVLLGALLSNILVFHVTMQPQTIALPLVLTVLWFALAYHHRARLLQLFTK
jgi:putative oxidoreductase